MKKKTITSGTYKGQYYSRTGETVPKRAQKWWVRFRMHPGPSKMARIARGEIGRHLREREVWELRYWNKSKVLAWFVWINGIMFCRDNVNQKMGNDNIDAWTATRANLLKEGNC